MADSVETATDWHKRTITTMDIGTHTLNGLRGPFSENVYVCVNFLNIFFVLTLESLTVHSYQQAEKNNKKVMWFHLSGKLLPIDGRETC